MSRSSESNTGVVENNLRHPKYGDSELFGPPTGSVQFNPIMIPTICMHEGLQLEGNKTYRLDNTHMGRIGQMLFYLVKAFSSTGLCQLVMFNE